MAGVVTDTLMRLAVAAVLASAVLAWLAIGFLGALGTARLAETVHYLTDVLAGAATGLAVTLAIALANTAGWRPAGPG